MKYKKRFEESNKALNILKEDGLEKTYDYIFRIKQLKTLLEDIKANGCKETEEICWQSQGEDMSSMFYCCGKHIREWGIEEGLCSECKNLSIKIDVILQENVQKENKK